MIIEHDCGCSYKKLQKLESYTTRWVPIRIKRIKDKIRIKDKF